MASTVDIIVGSHVWIKDSDLGWVDGEVIQIFGDEVHVRTSNGIEVAERISEVHPKDMQAPLEGVDDLTRLLYLHEPGVLQNLATRYELNKIYTYAGNILLAVNPFQEVPQLYNSHMMELYKGATFGDLSPHIFAVADVAYRTMINEGKSISIIVRGESGAGKTKTTKILMEYLAYLSGGCGIEERTIEEQLLASDRIFEAFGNAKTILNNNSSRFGKFVQIQFDKSGRISGATIQTYFLERSRVCQISDLERNYHCFYLLCAAPDKEIKMYELGNPTSFYYLNQSNCFKREGVDDALEYVYLRSAMDTVGITKPEQEAIFMVVAAVLHLGNIDFSKGKERKTSMKDEKSRLHLYMAAKLLGCDYKSLKYALCFRSLKDCKEKPITITISLGRRDALAKILYSRLFDWIVEKVNVLIGQDSNSKSIIGVPDIYGFENIKSNSFEQFYINYAHEKLQQHFIQHALKVEQEEYSSEEIYWSHIEFDDNQDLLDLIEKPEGIIDRLDHACIFPTKPKIFSMKLYDKFGNDKRFSIPEPRQTYFTISHHGEGSRNVTYKTDLFMDKNKDVVVDHLAFLNASKCSLVAKMFPTLPDDYSKSSKKLSVSVGSCFKSQLQSLMETLNATELHHIWCVKPNKDLVPANFKNVNILHQLHWGGIIEATKMSSARYTTRNTFFEFSLHFGALSREDLWGISDHKAACQRILDKTELNGYQIGKTKVFCKARKKAELDARRTEVLGRASTIIQKNTRAYIARREYVSLCEASIRLQALCRYLLAYKEYEQIKREAAALRIQKTFKQYFCRKEYSSIRSFAIILQTGLRAMTSRDEYRIRKQTKATIYIQVYWRYYEAYSYYKQLQNEPHFSQRGWRYRVVRRELTKLKMVAKETNGLKEAKDKLEKHVEELTWCLQVEKKAKIDLEEAKIGEIVKLEEAQCAIQFQLEEARTTTLKEREAMERLKKKVLNLETKNQVMREPILKVAKEVDGLNKGKEKLEKHVKELTWCLQVEKKAKIDLEEAKIGEIVKLKEAQCAIQLQLEEARATTLREREAMERVKKRILNLETKNQVLMEKILKENHDLLIKSISQDLGFSNGNPIAASLIFKCLLQWRSFEAESTAIFDRVIQTFDGAIQSEKNNVVLCYWLSNSAALLMLIQRTVKLTEAVSVTPQRSAGRDLGALDELGPALLFKQQLTTFLEKIYRWIRDNLKKDISPMLAYCRVGNNGLITRIRTIEQSGKVVYTLNNYLSVMRENHVPSFIIRKVFTQTFSFINVELFNRLLSRQVWVMDGGVCVSGELVILSKLEQWCSEATEEYVGSCWDELKHIRQAVGFLNSNWPHSSILFAGARIRQMTLKEITHDICPALNNQQLYRICNISRGDFFFRRHIVSDEVISSLRVMIAEESGNITSTSYLLHDDASISITVEDVLMSLDQVEMVDVDPPPLLRENSWFAFLLQRAE